MPGVGVSIPRPPAGVAAPQAGVAPMPPAPYAGVAPPATIAGVASQRLRLPPGFAAAAAAGAAAEPAGGAAGARPDALVGTAPKAASIQSCQLSLTSLLWIRGEAGQEAQLLGMQAQADKQATPQHPAQLHQVRASPETAVGAAAAATLLGGHRRRCVRPPVTCSDTANLLHSLLPLVSAPAPSCACRQHHMQVAGGGCSCSSACCRAPVTAAAGLCCAAGCWQEQPAHCCCCRLAGPCLNWRCPQVSRAALHKSTLALAWGALQGRTGRVEIGGRREGRQPCSARRHRHS